MRFLLPLLILLLFFSCNSADKTAKTIPRDVFVDLLVDIHICDAMATDHSLNDYLENIDSLTLYNSIFAKYNVSSESFKATMRWYSSKSEKFEKLYDEVFGKINKLNQELTDKEALFSYPDINEIFSTTDNYFVIGDTAHYPDPFVIPTKGKGIYLISAHIRIRKEDQSKNPKFLCYFLKEESDNKADQRKAIVDFPMQKTNFSREYQFTEELKDTNYKYLKIVLPTITNTDSSFDKNFQLSSLRVFFIDEKHIEKMKEKKNPQK